MPKGKILYGPFQVSFCSKSFAVLKENLDELMENFTLGSNLNMVFSFSLIDDFEEKPLLQGISNVRSLFTMGEFFEGICEAGNILGIRILAFVPVGSGVIQIRLQLKKGINVNLACGMLVCFRTMIEYLLFSRGLIIKAAKANSMMVEEFGQPEFINVFERLLAQSP